MNWQNLREILLPKAYDLMLFSAMVMASALLGTAAIAIPVLLIKQLTIAVCH